MRLPEIRPAIAAAALLGLGAALAQDAAEEAPPSTSRGRQRDLRAAGGNRKTHTAVQLGLDWLKNHQYADGKWHAAHSRDQCKLNRCDGQGKAAYTAGVTGLATLAFLGDAHTHDRGRYKAVVRAALRYLESIQGDDGCYGSRTDTRFLYNHAACALAMAETYRITKSRLFRKNAQQGVAFAEKAQNPYLGWRYGIRDGDNDTSVTAWMALVLASAKASGLQLTSNLKGPLAWIDKMTHPETGRVGYVYRGGPPDRGTAMAARFPVAKTEATTAMGLRVRLLAGQDPKKTDAITKGVELLLARRPAWSRKEGTIDLPYWYFGTQSLFRVGGSSWKKWNDALKKALVTPQRTEQRRDERGSWDPVGAWGVDGGRVYATALACLCLEVYWQDPKSR